jgi:cyanophycinase
VAREGREAGLLQRREGVSLRSEGMSIHLVGGGSVGEQALRVYGMFVAEAVQRARQSGRPAARIGVVQLHEGDAAVGRERVAQFVDMLARLGYNEPVPVLLKEGDTLVDRQLEGLDALLVAGGLTPAYLTAVLPVQEQIRALVADGTPYLGFSAGAAVAARRAIVGGWKMGDLVMCPEENGEELDELTVADGLGLVDFAVDVHAVQWGNVTRTMMAVSSGAVERAVAVDESTVLVVAPDGSHTVNGVGQAWWVDPAPEGVTVRTEREQQEDSEES